VHTLEEDLSAAIKSAGDWWHVEVLTIEQKVVRVQSAVLSRRQRLNHTLCAMREELFHHFHEMIFDITADKLVDLLIFFVIPMLWRQ
jgi:ribosomal protein S3AE